MKLKKVQSKSESQIAKIANRQDILDFEKQLAQQEGAVFGDNDYCHLKHSFCEGMYVREIFIPKGTWLTGKIHKHDHPNFLLKGKVEMATEFGGIEILKAPMSLISKAGTKRAIRTITDTVWVTVHLNFDNTQDIAKLESRIIAKDYNEFDKMLSKSNTIKNRIFGFIKKKLNLPL